MKLERRVLLTSSLATTSAIALAACAGEAPTAETTAPSATEDTYLEQGGEVLVGNIDEIPVGTGTKVKVNEELTILVTHPSEAKFRAFSATCTHAGCIVSGVQDGQIACSCHGARFNTDSGEPESGPAQSALKKINLEVRGKELWALFTF
jgi:Rieske Fe-S protein